MSVAVETRLENARRLIDEALAELRVLPPPVEPGEPGEPSEPVAPPPEPGNGAFADPNFRVGFLWKDISESDGKLVVLLPANMQNVMRVEIRRTFAVGSEVIELGRYTGIHNGGRRHYRFQLPGYWYPVNCWLVATLNNSDAVAWLIETPGARVENRVPMRINAGQGTPAPAPPSGGGEPTDVLPFAAGVWTESRSWQNNGRLRAPWINCVRDLRQRQDGAWNVPILHELYAPWNAPYTMAQVTNWMAQAEGMGFARICAYDMEGAGYFARGHLQRVCDTVRGRGWKMMICPKITLDLSGRYHIDAPTYDGTLALLARNADALGIWGYGSAASHIGAAQRIRRGYAGQILHIHDTFRNQAGGYIGATEGERTFAEAARIGRSFLAFQPWGETDEGTWHRMNAMVGR